MREGQGYPCQLYDMMMMMMMMMINKIKAKSTKPVIDIESKIIIKLMADANRFYLY